MRAKIEPYQPPLKQVSFYISFNELVISLHRDRYTESAFEMGKIFFGHQII